MKPVRRAAELAPILGLQGGEGISESEPCGRRGRRGKWVGANIDKYPLTQVYLGGIRNRWWASVRCTEDGADLF